MRKFRVRYARVVVLEATIEAECREEVKDDERLPGVYDGIPAEMIPPAVDGVTDYESIWEVEEVEDEEADVGGPLRLGCTFCDRDDFDGIHDLPADWLHIREVQDHEQSTKPGSFSDKPGESCLDWQTHLGVCPACQQEQRID